MTWRGEKRIISEAKSSPGWAASRAISRVAPSSSIRSFDEADAVGGGLLPGIDQGDLGGAVVRLEDQPGGRHQEVAGAGVGGGRRGLDRKGQQGEQGRGKRWRRAARTDARFMSTSWVGETPARGWRRPGRG